MCKINLIFKNNKMNLKELSLFHNNAKRNQQVYC